MIARPLGMIAGCVATLALALAQQGDAPPAIAQWGITNWASHIPPQLPGGSVARGSLVRIRGWRLGPAPRETITVVVRRNQLRARARTLSADENELQVLLPEDAPLGSAMLQVVKGGGASLEWPVTIVASSFGAFARNGQGWGPGEISGAGGVPNSETHASQPGDTVALSGTGLGVAASRNPPQVLVAGRPAKTVRVGAGSSLRPGVDTIEFTLPQDSPEGCHVPVQVSSAPGIYSNTVTLSVSRTGGACTDPGAWLAGPAQQLKLGTVALLHADLLLGLTSTQVAHFPVDAGFASFAAIEPDATANPLFLFPPPGTCTAYSGTAGLRSITSPLAALEALPGVPLDIGPNVTVEGAGGSRLLPRDHSAHRNYWAVIGGRSPAPGAKESPLFLSPGKYLVRAAGGPGLGAFQTPVEMAAPVVWTNREELAEVERARGVTVTWSSSRSRGFVLVVAMNVDSRSGAMGACVCLSHADQGSYRVPAYALANIPPTPAHPRGFPLNLMLVAELPEDLGSPTAGMDVDRLLAFAASISGRTVQFK